MGSGLLNLCCRAGGSELYYKEQVMGLMAHMFLMVQLSRDLGGNHCLQYDKDFREWAAAKHLKVWGELNLTINGRCLPMHQRPMLAPRSNSSTRQSEKWAKSLGPQRGCCYKWNFDGTCPNSASTCRYRHVCHYCGDDHRAANCPSPMQKVFKPIHIELLLIGLHDYELLSPHADTL